MRCLIVSVDNFHKDKPEADVCIIPVTPELKKELKRLGQAAANMSLTVKSPHVDGIYWTSKKAIGLIESSEEVISQAIARAQRSTAPGFATADIEITNGASGVEMRLSNTSYSSNHECLKLLSPWISLSDVEGQGITLEQGLLD
jgi:hypothetical protein